MITITLEGNTWSDILREMSIIEASVRGSRIEAKPDEGIVVPDKTEGQDGPKKPVCMYCGMGIGSASVMGRFCSVACADMFRHDPHHYGLGPEERAEILERVRQ